MNYTVNGGNKNADIKITEKQENGILYLQLNMKLSSPEIPERFSVNFKFSAADCAFTWNPGMMDIHGLYFDWGKKIIKSRLASWMPLQQLISRTGKNKLLIAVSDVDTPIEIGTGICEEDATIDCSVSFFTLPTTPVTEYTAEIRLDMRNMTFSDSIYEASAWWENECGYKSAFVPEGAREPVDSLWYSFHQNLDKEEIIKECKASYDIGMKTVIIDDGWQTDDNNRGYAYCGDWQVAPKKMGDMKELVNNIHNIGMKIMLWYSVPFMGIYCDKYNEFKICFLTVAVTKKHFSLSTPDIKR